MLWAFRLPDLAALHVFLWVYIKAKVCVTEPRDIMDFKQRIVGVCASISAEIIQRAVGSMEKRLMVSIEAEGRHSSIFLHSAFQIGAINLLLLKGIVFLLKQISLPCPCHILFLMFLVSSDSHQAWA